MVFFENHIFSQIKIGESAELTRTLRPEDIRIFAALSGDSAPPVNGDDSAQSGLFREVAAHGMWSASLVTTLLGTQFPGPGTVLAAQNLTFLRPVGIGDRITVKVVVKSKFEHNHHVLLDCLCTNQDGLTVAEGSVEVTAPTDRLRRARQTPPELKINDRAARYQHLLARAAGVAAVPMAVVHPCDAPSLTGALAAADAKLIIPLMVGPEARIRAIANECKASLEGIEIIDVPHSHAAAAKAVELAREGRAEALMKGSLHTDELMGEIIRGNSGLRTERRISHVFIMDVPSYPRPLMITDAAVSIEPSLEDKVDIVQNAIDLAHTLDIEEPRVAILSAIETVTPKMRSTVEAAALCKMADRGQIRGGILDGPLAFDNAISLVAAKTKGIHSAVAGRADILVVPDLESGNMLAKQLEYLADALTAGVVCGARVPIVLTSRADTAETRAASCAVAAIMADRRRRGTPLGTF